MYAAAWAYTAVVHGAFPLATATATAAAAGAARSDAGGRGGLAPVGTASAERAESPAVRSGVWFGSGAAVMLAVVALLRRRKRD